MQKGPVAEFQNSRRRALGFARHRGRRDAEDSGLLLRDKKKPSLESEKRIDARFCTSLAVRPENETQQAASKVLLQNPVKEDEQ